MHADVIKYNGKLINSAVKRWVEKYETDPKSAFVDLLMMIFEVTLGIMILHLSHCS